MKKIILYPILLGALYSAIQLNPSISPWLLSFYFLIALLLFLVLQNFRTLFFSEDIPNYDYVNHLIRSNNASRLYFKVIRACEFTYGPFSDPVIIFDIGSEDLLCLQGAFMNSLIDEETSRQFPTQQFSVVVSKRGHSMVLLEPGDDVLDSLKLDTPKQEQMQELRISPSCMQYIENTSFEKAIQILSHGPNE